MSNHEKTELIMADFLPHLTIREIQWIKRWVFDDSIWHLTVPYETIGLVRVSEIVRILNKHSFILEINNNMKRNLITKFGFEARIP